MILSWLFDIAFPFRIALEQWDFGRQYVLIIQILCFKLHWPRLGPGVCFYK